MTALNVGNHNDIPHADMQAYIKENYVQSLSAHLKAFENWLWLHFENLLLNAYIVYEICYELAFWYVDIIAHLTVF